jgi:AcrR family transcriptional regulator
VRPAASPDDTFGAMGSSGRVGRPPAGDSAETRRRILHAARIRFARDGFRATTNRLIADDVGITSGAIYHYVESKAELYAAVYCETIDEVYTEFERVAAREPHLLDQFSAVLRRACELQSDDPSITGFIVAVAQETQRHPDLLALLSPQRGRHSRFFTGLVDTAAARGELVPDVDRRALADLLGSVLTGLARMAAAAGDPERYTAAVDVLERFFDGTLVTAR